MTVEEQHIITVGNIRFLTDEQSVTGLSANVLDREWGWDSSNNHELDDDDLTAIVAFITTYRQAVGR